MARDGVFNSFTEPGFGISCRWSATQNMRTNKTTIKVRVFFNRDSHVIDPRIGTIDINGDIKRFESELIDSSSLTSGIFIGEHVAVIQHEADGTAPEVPITVTWRYNGYYEDDYIENITAETVAVIDNIETRRLYIKGGEGYRIYVKRIFSYADVEPGIVTDGEILYFGDRLRITYEAEPGYIVASHTVNDVLFKSGWTMPVDYKDIRVSATAVVVNERLKIYNSDRTPFETLYQWDRNISIIIKDYSPSPTPVIQFSNRFSEEAISVTLTTDGTDLFVDIPNVLLEKPEVICGHICEATDGQATGEVLHVIYLPVSVRKRYDTE